MQFDRFALITIMVFAGCFVTLLTLLHRGHGYIVITMLPIQVILLCICRIFEFKFEIK